MVAAVLKERGDHPGLVHVRFAMEACDAYEPWHDKQSHQTFLRRGGELYATGDGTFSDLSVAVKSRR